MPLDKDGSTQNICPRRGCMIGEGGVGALLNSTMNSTLKVTLHSSLGWQRFLGTQNTADVLGDLAVQSNPHQACP